MEEISSQRCTQNIYLVKRLVPAFDCPFLLFPIIWKAGVRARAQEAVLAHDATQREMPLGRQQGLDPS
jgi:hypothetical protein